MHGSLVLSLLSLAMGLTNARQDKCEWTVKLCNLGDPTSSSSVCIFNSAHPSVTAGMEEQELSPKVQPIIESLTDQAVDTENTAYYGFPYYLRIDLDCESKEESMRAMQEALITGLNPSVILTVQEPVHPTRLKPQRLNVVMTSAPLSDNVQCDNDLCQMGWYVPMPILNGSVVYNLKVMSNGQGRDVSEKSFAINANGYMYTVHQQGAFGTEMIALETVLKSGIPSRPVWATYERAPVLVLPRIPGYKAILITSTEFNHTTLIELGVESCWVDSFRCPQMKFDVMIQEAIATESSLFIRQNQLLHRFIGNYSLLSLQTRASGAWQQVLRSACVSKMVPVPTVHEGWEFFYIIGGGVQTGTLYRADIQGHGVLERPLAKNVTTVHCHLYSNWKSAGATTRMRIRGQDVAHMWPTWTTSGDADITFSELQDSKGQTFCAFLENTVDYSLRDQKCIITWVSQRGDQHLSDIILGMVYNVSHWYYHVVLHDESFHIRGTLPKYIPQDGSKLFIVTDDETSGTAIRVVMDGMVYNPISGILYFWGNTLICSLDEGLTYLSVRGFSSNERIKYFTLSYHGEFAFVTETEQIWWGEEGMDTVASVRPSMGWSTFSSLQILRRYNSYLNPPSLLTVFWDSDKQLQEVIYIKENGKGRVVKRKIPVAEIMSYNLFSASSSQVSHYDTYSTFDLPRPCPFFWEHLEDLPQPEPYNRIQHYLARPPLVVLSSGLHTVASLATYQGLLHHLLRLHSEYIQDIGDPAQNPISRWWKDKMEYVDYFFYMSSNGLSSSGFNVEIDGYSRLYENPEISFPDKVYLDLDGSFSFSVYIRAGSRAEVSRDDIKNIWLSAEVSDNEFLYVTVVRQEIFNRGAIFHKVTVADRGAFPGQSLAGEGLRPFTLLLKISNSEMQCFQQTNLGIVSQGQYRLTVYLGCPPGKRLAFDITKTLEESARLNKRYFDCPYPGPDIPCFYYEDSFYPFFLIQDMVLGESGPFLGSYTLKIVGGGTYSRNNIRYFTPEEVLLYNSVNHSSKQTLVWIFDDMLKSANKTKEGFVVLSGTNNKIRWLCQRNSPCGDMLAQGLRAPDYFFVVEVSNKGVDMSTYCDYALRFEIHVHGFPLDPSRSLYYMLMTLATIWVLLFCYIVFHCCGPGIKTVGMAAYDATKIRPKIEQDSDIILGMDDPAKYLGRRR